MLIKKKVIYLHHKHKTITQWKIYLQEHKSLKEHEKYFLMEHLLINKTTGGSNAPF